MAPEGKDEWVEFKGRSGNTQYVYDSSVTTKEEAEAKNYPNVQNVSKEMTVGSGKDSYRLSDNATVTNLTTGADVKPGFMTADGSYIGENNMSKSLASGSQKGGDEMTLYGVGATVLGGGVIGAPTVLIGGILSGVGTGLELMNDAFEGKLTLEKTLTKVGLYFVGNKLGKVGKNQSEKVINTGLINLLDKGIDDARNNKKGPFK